MDYTSVPPCEIANQRPSSKWPKVVAALATSLVIAVGVVCCILYSSRMKTDSSAMLNMVELPKGVCAVTEADRVNCGHSGITEAACVSRQCCWIKSNSDGRCYIVTIIPLHQALILFCFQARLVSSMLAHPSLHPTLC